MIHAFTIREFARKAAMALVAALLAVVASLAVVAATSTPATAEKAYAGGITEMYRLYNKYSGEHLFTADTGEQDKLLKAGWTAEGTAWVAPKTGTAVYRLYNKWSGDHHYTTDVSEYNKCKKAGWKGEDVAFYSDGDLPVYRLYNKYVKSFYHHYTMDASEQKKCKKNGWKDEGVGWYGYESTGWDGNVVITRTGKKYHQADCPTIKNSTGTRTCNAAEAAKSGYTACQDCFF